MNPNAPARSSGYHQKALDEIHNSIQPFAKNGTDAVGSSAASTISNLSMTSGVSSLSSLSGSNSTEKDIQLRQILGFSEVNQYLYLHKKHTTCCCFLKFRTGKF